MQESPAGVGGSMDSVVGRVADEFLSRVERGEQPAVEDYARRHPELAAVLRQVLPALQSLRQSPSPGGAGAAPAEDPPPCLGDFRILREVGRGGMAVVYEAEQLSLGRRVALKVLPSAAALDERHLQRFKNEAQAAAQLRHPHVVPVLAFGCEQGVHYYAMQFIEGYSLASLIAGLRHTQGAGPCGPAGGPDLDDTVSQPGTPAPSGRSGPAPGSGSGGSSELFDTDRPGKGRGYFRAAARLLVQAAEALEHAHQCGVVHRDVKPANLLVDRKGDLWVADFGLARLQGDPGLTTTGDLVGTVRYMSPEQAQGKPGLLDHRTDVYSLGATAYELLTLEPPVAGSDRQELLRKILAEEPRRPRRVNPAVPADLETIVVKAMEKSPSDRYATAQELADDLSRFLAGEPIRARPPTPWQVASKWARRHTGVVRTAAAAAAVVALILAGAVGLLAQKNAELGSANGRLTDALGQLGQKNDELGRAKENLERTVAQVRKQEAETQEALGQAKRNREVALNALAGIVTNLIDKRMSQDRLWANKADQLLDYVTTGLEQLTAAGPGQKPPALRLGTFSSPPRLTVGGGADPEVRGSVAWLFANVGQNYGALGRYDKAKKAFGKAIALREQLANEFPGDYGQRVMLSQTYRGLADLLRSVGDVGGAAGQYEKALGVWHKPVKMPTCPFEGSEALESFGDLLAERGDREGAAEKYRRCVELYPQAVAMYQGSPDRHAVELRMAERHLKYGDYLRTGGDRAGAREQFRKAQGLAEALARAPGLPQYQLFLAQCCRSLAALAEDGDPAAAAGLYGRAREILEPLARREPGRVEYREPLADTHLRLGDLAKQGGPAADHFRKAKELYAEMAADLPNGDPGPGSPGACQNNLAWFLATCPDPQFRDPARAVEQARKAVKRAELQGAYWNTLGVAQYRAGKWKEAAEALEKAAKLNAARGGDAIDWLFLAMARWQLGEKDQARSAHKKALDWVKEHKAGGCELRRFRQEAAALIAPENKVAAGGGPAPT